MPSLGLELQHISRVEHRASSSTLNWAQLSLCLLWRNFLSKALWLKTRPCFRYQEAYAQPRDTRLGKSSLPRLLLRLHQGQTLVQIPPHSAQIATLECDSCQYQA